MKINLCTIGGFYQKQVIKYDLKPLDLFLIEWLIDFILTPNKKSDKKINSKIIKGRKYFRVNYKKIIEDLSFLEIKNKETIAKHFKTMVKKNFLYFYQEKKLWGIEIWFSFNEEMLYPILASDKIKMKLLRKLAVGMAIFKQESV